MYPDGWFDPNSYCINNWNNCVNIIDSNVSISLISKTKEKSCGIWNLRSGRQKEDQVYEFQCEAQAEEILLSKPNSNIAVYELQLFAEHGTGRAYIYTRKTIAKYVNTQYSQL